MPRDPYAELLAFARLHGCLAWAALGGPSNHESTLSKRDGSIFSKSHRFAGLSLLDPRLAGRLLAVASIHSLYLQTGDPYYAWLTQPLLKDLFGPLEGLHNIAVLLWQTFAFVVARSVCRFRQRAPILDNPHHPQSNDPKDP